MWRQKLLSTKRHSTKTHIKAGVTEGEAGHQLVQPGSLVHPSWTGDAVHQAGHVWCPAGKHGGEVLLRCGWTAGVGGTAGVLDLPDLRAEGLPVQTPS